jgi:hypothetical protein
MMIRRSLLAGFAVCALLLALGQNRVHAQGNSFWIKGAGVGPQGLPLPGEPPRPHWAKGIATDLGIYYGQGSVQTNTANFLPNGDITGTFGSGSPFVFTGRDGDKLACYYGRTDFGASKPGTFTLVPVPELGQGVYIAFFVAQFVPYLPECTGKFAGVRGGWVMYAMTDPFVLGSDEPLGYGWVGEGSLVLK